MNNQVDMDDEEVEENEALNEQIGIFRPLSIGVRSGSTKSRDKTAMNHFNRFAAASAIPSFDAMRLEDFTSDTIANFADYMIRVAKVKSYNTIIGYISSMKNLFERDTRFKHSFHNIVTDAEYGDLRKNVSKHYNRQSVITGVPVQQSSPPMTEKDLEILCKIMFQRDSDMSIHDRCLLIWQWQSIGRVSETSNLKFTDIEFLDKTTCFKVNMSRSKTATQHVRGYSFLSRKIFTS